MYRQCSLAAMIHPSFPFMRCPFIVWRFPRNATQRALQPPPMPPASPPRPRPTRRPWAISTAARRSWCRCLHPILSMTYCSRNDITSSSPPSSPDIVAMRWEVALLLRMPRMHVNSEYLSSFEYSNVGLVRTQGLWAWRWDVWITSVCFMAQGPTKRA